MANIGTTSASSLVNAALSGQKQLATLQDAQQSFIFDFSAQTADDLKTYQDYLNGRIKTLSGSSSLGDADKAISLQRTLISAQRTYRTNQIQQSTIDVVEGNASPQDKVNKLASLYQDAMSNGDIQSAQTIQLQYDNAEKALLNASSGTGSGGSGTAANTLAYNQVQDYVDKLSGKIPTGQPITDESGNPLPNLRDLGQAYKNGQLTAKEYYAGAAAVAQAIQGTYQQGIDAAKASGDLSHARTLTQDLNGLMTGTSSLPALPTTDNGKSLSLADLAMANRQDLNQNPLYRPITDASGNIVQTKNAITGYNVVSGDQTNGNKDGFTVVAQTSPTGYKSGESTAAKNIAAQIQKNGGGYKATVASNGNVEITYPGDGGTHQFTVNPDGSLTSATNYGNDANLNPNIQLTRFNYQQGQNKPEGISYQELQADTQSQKLENDLRTTGGKNIGTFFDQAGKNQMLGTAKQQALAAIAKFRSQGYNDLADQVTQQLDRIGGAHGSGLLDLGGSVGSLVNNLSSQLNQLNILAANRQSQAFTKSITPPPAQIQADTSAGKLNPTSPNFPKPGTTAPYVAASKVIGSQAFNNTFTDMGSILNGAFK